MGFFSWKTCDTNRSIANKHSSKSTFKVHMITEDGRIFTETEYNGYGEFGDKDFYELLAELNGKSSREDGIDISFANENHSGNYNGKFNMPKFIEKLPHKSVDWEKFWNSLDYPKSCEDQGYFY